MPDVYGDATGAYISTRQRLVGITLKSAQFQTTSSVVVVAPVVGKRIKVYATRINASANVSVRFTDTGVPLEGNQALLSRAVTTESVNPPAFLFATSPGGSLNLAITGNATVAGRVSYWDDDAI